MTLVDLLLAAAACTLFVAAICDMRHFEIPNRLSVILGGLAIAYGFAQQGDHPWLWHMASFALMFGLGLFIFAIGWMGGGDVKLLFASSAFVPLWQFLDFIGAIFIAGGVLSLVLLLGRRLVRTRPAWLAHAPRMWQDGAPVPYAIAIAGGIYVWAAQAGLY